MSKNASPPCFVLFAHGFFNNAIRTSDYITSNSIIVINWKECGMEWSKAGTRYHARVIPVWTEANHENPWYRYSQGPNRHLNVPNTNPKGYRLVALPNPNLSGSGT
jgi:hypothetical protein